MDGTSIFLISMPLIALLFYGFVLQRRLAINFFERYFEEQRQALLAEAKASLPTNSDTKHNVILAQIAVLRQEVASTHLGMQQIREKLGSLVTYQEIEASAHDNVVCKAGSPTHIR